VSTDSRNAGDPIDLTPSVWPTLRMLLTAEQRDEFGVREDASMQINIMRAVRGLSDKLDHAERFIGARGYRRCDIAACNCGKWHGGNAEDRLREISDTLASEAIPGGTTIHGGVLLLIQRAEQAERRAARLEAANQRVRKFAALEQRKWEARHPATAAEMTNSEMAQIYLRIAMLALTPETEETPR